MKITHRIILSVSAVAVLTLSGCASVAVTDDALVNNTSKVLVLEKSKFTITDRNDDGIQTSYNVKTDSGKKYSCYVTGTISIVGRTVSDPVCTEQGKSAATPKKTTCNALLKAAGKC